MACFVDSTLWRTARLTIESSLSRRKLYFAWMVAVTKDSNIYEFRRLWAPSADKMAAIRADVKKIASSLLQMLPIRTIKDENAAIIGPDPEFTIRILDQAVNIRAQFLLWANKFPAPILWRAH